MAEDIDFEHTVSQLCHNIWRRAPATIVAANLCNTLDATELVAEIRAAARRRDLGSSTCYVAVVTHMTATQMAALAPVVNSLDVNLIVVVDNIYAVECAQLRRAVKCVLHMNINIHKAVSGLAARMHNVYPTHTLEVISAIVQMAPSIQYIEAQLAFGSVTHKPDTVLRRPQRLAAAVCGTPHTASDPDQLLFDLHGTATAVDLHGTAAKANKFYDMLMAADQLLHKHVPDEIVETMLDSGAHAVLGQLMTAQAAEKTCVENLQLAASRHSTNVCACKDMKFSGVGALSSGAWRRVEDIELRNKLAKMRVCHLHRFQTSKN